MCVCALCCGMCVFLLHVFGFLVFIARHHCVGTHRSRGRWVTVTSHTRLPAARLARQGVTRSLTADGGPASPTPPAPCAVGLILLGVDRENGSIDDKRARERGASHVTLRSCPQGSRLHRPHTAPLHSSKVQTNFGSFSNKPLSQKKKDLTRAAYRARLSLLDPACSPQTGLRRE